MKKPVHLFASLITAMTLLVAAPMALAEEAAPATPTQGDIAIILAQKLGFFVGITKPPTAQEAVKLLLENRISPFAGWMIDEPMMGGDLARILVQALGRDGEIDAEERDNPETKAYEEFLVREYNFDIANILEELAKLKVSPNPQDSGETGEAVSTDPLKGSGDDGTEVIPVTETLVKKALEILPAARGGGDDGQQVDDSKANVTPSVPVPVAIPTQLPLG